MRCVAIWTIGRAGCISCDIPVAERCHCTPGEVRRHVIGGGNGLLAEVKKGWEHWKTGIGPPASAAIGDMLGATIEAVIPTLILSAGFTSSTFFGCSSASCTTS